jgi:protein-L-isoaspartate(D-aspartate) O-methyltransferase
MEKQPYKDEFDAVRKRMLRDDLESRGITDPRVLKAMADIPRQEFIPTAYRNQAYSDGPLPIGDGQTISQPFMVALMTQELRIGGRHEVLEIGTGSGYQTAVLSRFAKKVYTIERFDDLSGSARKVLAKMGIRNVEFHIGDGSCGWPEPDLPPSGKFDRIMVTAAVPEIPGPLIEQLADSGIMVIPVGYEGMQELITCEKRGEKLIQRSVCGVRFVRLLGKYGF